MKKLILIALSFFAMNAFASEGAELYKKCAACHGMNGEKKALNKSQIITDFTKEEALAALMGYKDGSYGGSMKALMKAQIATYSDEQLEKVAEYIGDMKK